MRRAALGPVAVSTGLTVTTALAVTAVAAGLGAGWVLTWLLLGLTAGYALSGSA